MRKKWIAELIVAAMLALSCSNATTTQQITPTSFPVPTFVLAEDFQCWTSAALQISKENERGLGELLIVSAKQPATQPDLYRFNFTTSEYSLLASDIEGYDNGQPSPVSPSGRYFWYGVYRDPSGDIIFVYDLIDNIAYQVPFPGPIRVGGDAISWSPDDQCLIHWQDDSAIAYRLTDGAMQQRIFPETVFDYEVGLSLNGQWRAWPCADGICVMSSNGQKVAHDALRIPLNVDDSGHRYYKRGFVRWSPDSRVLVFAYARVCTLCMDTLRLIFWENDRIVSYRHIFAPAVIANVAWSPDGNRLLIANGHGNSLQIYDKITQEVKTVNSPHRAFTKSWNGRRNDLS